MPKVGEILDGLPLFVGEPGGTGPGGPVGPDSGIARTIVITAEQLDTPDQHCVGNFATGLTPEAGRAWLIHQIDWCIFSAAVFNAGIAAFHIRLEVGPEVEAGIPPNRFDRAVLIARDFFATQSQLVDTSQIMTFGAEMSGHHPFKLPVPWVEPVLGVSLDTDLTDAFWTAVVRVHYESIEVEPLLFREWRRA